MTRPIRVLQFSSVVNRDDFIDVIVRHGDREAFRYGVCSYRPSHIRDPEYGPDGIAEIRLDEPTSRWIHPGVVLGLARVVEAWRPDVVHAHHFYESVEAVLACRMQSHPVRVIYGRHFSDEFTVSLSGMKRWSLVALDNWLLGAADRIIVPTSEIVELVARQSGRVAGVEEIPYACDFTAPKFQRPDPESAGRLRVELGLGPEVDFVVVNVGRHHPIKDQESLLEAFARFARTAPNARLLMVGDGDHRETLERRAGELEVRDRVIFTGWRRDAGAVASLGDVLVQSSLQEAFPQVMIEAMGLGLPVVTTPVSGTRLMIQNGATGLTVGFRDVEGIATALDQLHREPGLRIQLGEAGRRRAHDLLTLDRVVPAFESVYRDLAAGSVARSSGAGPARRGSP